jgi:hypothetical protein
MKRRNFIGLGTAAGIAAGSASLLSFKEKDFSQKKE